MDGHNQQVDDCVLDVLTYDKKYEQLARYLFSNVSIRSAIGQTSSVEHTVIQIDGTLLEEGSHFLEDRLTLFEGKRLGRKKQVEKLVEEIEQLNEQKSTIDTRLLALDSEKKSLVEADLSQKLRLLYQEQNQFNQQRSVTQSRIKLIQQEIQEADQLIEKKNNEVAQLMEKVASLDEKRSIQATSLTAKLSDEQQLKGQIDEMDGRRRLKSQQANSLQIEWLQKKNASDQHLIIKPSYIRICVMICINN